MLVRFFVVVVYFYTKKRQQTKRIKEEEGKWMIDCKLMLSLPSIYIGVQPSWQKKLQLHRICFANEETLILRSIGSHCVASTGVQIPASCLVSEHSVAICSEPDRGSLGNCLNASTHLNFKNPLVGSPCLLSHFACGNIG